MCIKERLKQIIETQGLTIKAFSEITEIPYRSVQNYLREEREPNTEALIKISEKMNIDLNWLLIGTGEMFKKEQFNQFTDKEIQLIRNYQKMSSEIKNVFDISFETISKSIK